VTARQRRFWWAAALVGTLVAGVAFTFLWIIKSEGGRRFVLARLVTTIDAAFGGRGALRIGALRELGWSRIVADSVSIVDSAGVPVITMARLAGSLDYAALLNRTVHFRVLELTDMRADLRRDRTGPWNFAYILSGNGPAKPRVAPGFGDDIRIDTLRLTSGAVTTLAPWAPHPIFVGSAIDSVIAVRDSLHDLLKTPSGLFERRRIAIDRLVGHDGIIMDPSQKPSHLVIDSLRGIVSDPPVRIAAAAGRIEWTPDSLRLELPTVRLPASSGSASGRVWWNQPGAVRFDVAIKAQAALSDLTWIWDVLPTVGSGSADVHMRTLESADDAEYTLTALKVASGASRLTGQISVVVRPATMLLREVDLAVSPITSELMRRLSYGAVPAEVKGTVRGRLVAPIGGPLTNFVFDLLDAQFTDATIAGAVSSVRASGVAVMGVAPSVRNTMVEAISVDLRSARALAPTLPAVDGVVAGRGRIVSADLVRADVRNWALTWTDAVGNLSRVRGDARIAYGVRVPTVNMSLAFEPFSLKALARVDTTLRVSSALSGHLTVSGSLDSLRWTGDVGADSLSRIVAEGTAMWHQDRWRIAAVGTARDVDASAWFGRSDMPRTAISGTMNGTAAGRRDTAGVLMVDAAQASMMLVQREGAERPGFDLLASAALIGEQFRVDSATMHIGGVTLDARGALARRGQTVPLAGATLDTMVVSATADSLEAVQRQLTRIAASVAAFDSSSAASLRSFASDTLRGDASLSGYLVGSLDDFAATLALGARAVQVGAIRVGRVFGSLRAQDVRSRPTFEGVATADEITGIGAIRIASAEFKVQSATPDSGRLVLDASSVDDAHLVVRGGYARANGITTVVADSLGFLYDSLSWRSAAPIRVVSDASGFTIDSVQLRSSRAGMVSLQAVVPTTGPISGALRLVQFPIGEAAAFAAGIRPFSGLLTGEAVLSGSRAAPLATWRLVADSLGMDGVYLPQVSSDGSYGDRRVIARALITDSLGGRLLAEARVPIDLTIATVEKRLLSDAVDADVTADSLRLEALAVQVAGIDRIHGAVTGHIRVGGTMERPVGTGTLTLSEFSARSLALGIEPVEGRAVVRAAQDSLILESFRLRSGRVGDTLLVRGALRYALNEPATMVSTVNASNFIFAQQRNGSALMMSGNIDARGPLRRPAVTGFLTIPAAVLVFDPLNASTALDLTSQSARELLTAAELPTVDGAEKSLSAIGQFVTVANLQVELGNEVWVRTPESTVRLSGRLNLVTRGDAIVPEGEILATRGQYRLDLGVANRSFSVDSGRVRFFGDAAIAPTLDVSATHVVRLTTGDEIPVGVHITGNIENPALTLSSTDPLYASAPESELISLLIFGAPTFALDGQSQSTVRAVTGVIVPGIGGAFEDGLQRLLPFKVNTVQISTSGGQGQDNRTDVASLLNLNLSVSVGKQIGDRTFLRVNTGLCRGPAQTSSGNPLWAGLAAEYRISRGLTAQIGVDPGAAPCSRIGGDPLSRLQFGFDLFREWIF